MKKYKYRELKRKLKYIIWIIAQIAKFLRTMLAIMLLIVVLAYMTTQIHFSNIHVLEKELTEHITDFIICQMANSLIIFSVISLLNEKGKQAYWTTTIDYILIEPKIIGMKAISTYVIQTNILSFVFYVLGCKRCVMISFSLSNILLMFIIYRLVKVYYNKKSILEELEAKFYVDYIKSQKEEKIKSQKEEHTKYSNENLNKIKSNTIEALLERNAEIYIENVNFLFKIRREIKDIEESNKLLSEVENTIMSICSFSFQKYRDEWADFYSRIFDELSTEFDAVCNKNLVIGWENFKKQNFIKLFLEGIKMERCAYIEDCDRQEETSMLAMNVLSLLESNTENIYYSINALGENLWNKPTCFDTHFAKTLFMKWTYVEKDNTSITVFEKRKGIYEKLSEYCTETALLGYYYSLMVFEKKIEESKMENDYNNGDTRKNLLEVIESVREDFFEFLDCAGYLDIVYSDELNAIDYIHTKKFSEKIDEKYKLGAYNKYTYSEYGEIYHFDE